MRLLLLPLSFCLLLLFSGSEGWSIFIDGKTVKVLDQKGTWDQMNIACRTEGAHMVKIDSADFMYGIVKFLKQQGLANRDFWIGATEVGHGGVFRWQDGTIVKQGTPFWGSPARNKNRLRLISHVTSMYSSLTACSSTPFE
ncbi:snaclec convulxin subunit beta-like [Penaeus japonicus]|uniref:snaclec convulxin subunit beta-like n=1 Tax=Penaeus japonicus TaxID=27405 RepID=UPI001C712963|nr:snaclec convulxin subunit beta-like [Penaeus japonicus]